MNAKGRIGLSNLEGAPKFDMNQVIEMLKAMPLVETVSWLSSLNLVLSNSRRTENLDQKLRPIFCNAGLCPKIEAFEKTQSIPGAVFHQQVVLLLIQMARKFCDVSIKMDSLKIKMNLGLMILASNDFISEIENPDFSGATRQEQLEGSTPMLIRQLLFMVSSQERYSIPRSWLIYEGLASQAAKENAYDVSESLQKVCGFSLENFYQVLHILYSYWARQTFEEWSPTFFSINPSNIFAQAEIDPKVYLSVMDSLSSPIRLIADLPHLDEHGKWQRFIYEFFDLRQQPLIKTDGVYLCADFEFVQNMFWEGPFHFILTKIKDSREKDQFLHYLGDTTEAYVRHLGKDAFGDRYKILDCGNGNPLGDGVIQLQDDWLVVVETKAARPSREMISGDKPITNINDFKKLLHSGLKQLSDRIHEFCQKVGFKGRITPCLVTAGYIPQHELLWELYLSGLQDIPMLKNGQVDFPLVIDPEAWEVLTSCEKANVPLEATLKERYSKNEWKQSSMRNFLYTEYFRRKGIEEPPHPVLISLFEDRMNILIKKLFQKDMKARTTPPDVWKEVFSLC